MIAFVGTSVTAADMLSRWESTVRRIENRERSLDELEGYVRWLAQQRFGAVFEASYHTDGLLVARKVGDLSLVRRVPIPE